jgi:ABC-type Fe3+ transport system substrate-binding protein
MFASTAVLLMMPSVVLSQTALDKIIASAKQESDLNLIGSASTFGGEGPRHNIEAAFNKKFGLNLKLHFVAGPSMPAMAARIQQEYKAGAKATTDVYIGTMALFTYLMKEGALTEIKWAETFPWITPEVETAKGAGVLVRTSISGIIYNPNLLNAAEAPRRYEDLVDPVKSRAWAGRMATPPYSDWLAELTMIWPKDKVIGFARNLAQYAAGFIRYDQEERIVSGEFSLMANDADGPYAKALWASKGGQLEFVVGSDPALVYYNMLGVPKNSSSPNLAALFAAYVSSEEAQAFTTEGFQGHHLVANTNVAKYLAANKIRLMSPQQQFDFYMKGADPGLIQELDAILRR